MFPVTALMVGEVVIKMNGDLKGLIVVLLPILMKLKVDIITIDVELSADRLNTKITHMGEISRVRVFTLELNKVCFYKNVQNVLTTH